jgi:hypothetical protein
MLKTFADNSKRYETPRSFPPWPTALCFVKDYNKKMAKEYESIRYCRQKEKSLRIQKIHALVKSSRYDRWIGSSRSKINMR